LANRSETHGNSELRSGFLLSGCTPKACCKKFPAGRGGCAITAGATMSRIKTVRTRERNMPAIVLTMFAIISVAIIIELDL
jgi:hypothetical protein